jgi:enediyne biosynthesis protein E4
LSQSELPLTFGLGKPEAGKTVSLTIVWPSGQKDSIANVEPNQFITVREGKGIISARPIVFKAALEGDSSQPLATQPLAH